MDKYIEGTLSIHPSSSSAEVAFFLLEKDKTLWPCIAYCGLNDIMVKNSYPL